MKEDAGQEVRILHYGQKTGSTEVYRHYMEYMGKQKGLLLEKALSVIIITKSAFYQVVKSELERPSSPKIGRPTNTPKCIGTLRIGTINQTMRCLLEL